MSKPTNIVDSFLTLCENTLLPFDDQLLSYNNFLKDSYYLYFYLLKYILLKCNIVALMPFCKEMQSILTNYATSLQSIFIYLGSSVCQIC